MALTGKSLDSVTVTGPGTAVTFDEPKSCLGMQFSFSGTASGQDIHLEATIDGSMWNTVAYIQNNSSGFISVNNIPAMGIRANVISIPSGSSVTAWVSAA